MSLFYILLKCHFLLVSMSLFSICKMSLFSIWKWSFLYKKTFLYTCTKFQYFQNFLSDINHLKYQKTQSVFNTNAKVIWLLNDLKHESNHRVQKIYLDFFILDLTLAVAWTQQLVCKFLKNEVTAKHLIWHFWC